MIFGPKFYPLLEKMTAWRQSLFALVLATRQYANFALWAELSQKQGASEFKKALQQCWEFHFDKFNHVDFDKVYDSIEPYIPEAEDNEGALFAFDACISLNACIDAIVISSNEACQASKASMASVIRLCENKYSDENLDEDSLLEKEEIEQEIDFQVALMEMVQEPRSTELITKLLHLAIDAKLSNIGLEQELSFEELYFEASKKDNKDNK